ncbi:discoidin domain-containing protein [Leifsonia xyli]|uniref:discoidin domain-containing protein n=1 Tax=Leifsonia xyli TaxID=1575 RepID=UPI00041BA38B|nr:discoidin domain-containing protein [Leifsonia xyli]
MLWDQDGSHYRAGAGLSVFQDGVLIHNQAALGDVTVPLSPAEPAALPRQVDDAANPSGAGFPRASASYSNPGDAPGKATDGQDFDLDIPSTWWTTYRTPNASDWLQVDFGAPTSVGELRVTFYDDGGGVQLPGSWSLLVRGRDGEWEEPLDQTRSPAVPAGGSTARVLLGSPIVTDAVRLVGETRPGARGWGVTSFGSGRTVDSDLSASIETRPDGTVAVEPGLSTDVTTRLATIGDSRVASDRLLAPRGWTVERVESASPRDASPGTVETTCRVTAPATLDRGEATPLRYEALSTAAGRSASALASATWAFDPPRFGDAVWDDDFSSDRLGEYDITGGLGEPAPDFAVDTEEGVLLATTDRRARGLVRIPVAATEEFALIVEPRATAAGRPVENSLFIGSSGGPDDFAMSWYNASKSESGVNVVIGATGQSEAEGGAAHPLTWHPGDRLATVVTNGRLTSWLDRDGFWLRIGSAPVDAAVPTGTLVQWLPSFALRLDAETIAIDRVTLLRGGLSAVRPAPVVFSDGDGSASGSYTVPVAPGAEYTLNGAVLAAGRYAGSGTVTIAARPMGRALFALDATTSWTHSFAGSGPETTEPETTAPEAETIDGLAAPGRAAPASAAGSGLANTGSDARGWTLPALLLLGAGLVLRALSRRLRPLRH